MSGIGREPSEELRQGRRALDGIPACAILNDLAWDPKQRVWTVQLRLRPGHAPTDHVPASTDWFLHLASDYPASGVHLYPAKDGGLAATFHHQDPNTTGAMDSGWRDGKICTDTGVRALGRHGYDEEPRNADDRARWHVLRALDWLVAAATGDLIRPGEPYELPAYPSKGTVVVAFDEDRQSFTQWGEVEGTSGIVELAHHPENPRVLAVRRMTTWGGAEARRSAWGRILTDVTREETGLWVRLETPPVVPPFQAPRTWGELIPVLRSQGMDLPELLERVPTELRNGRELLLLLGFGIPLRYGEPPEQMHWQAIQLPALARGHEKKSAPGFRPQKSGWKLYDLRHTFAPGKEVVYARTANWSDREISHRGRFSEQLRAQRVLLVGAGALGSAVAELLVRGGVYQLGVMDSDSVRVGNLVRHTLSVRDVGHGKADRLADRLNNISPHADVQYIPHAFPSEHQGDMVNKATLVLDCTASDDAAEQLAEFPWNSETRFLSLSLGLHARRLFVFGTPAPALSFRDFREQVQPWIEDERVTYAGEEMPMEGIGCWHAVFPARVDDIWKLAATAVRSVEEFVTNPPEGAILQVFEADAEDGGVRRVWG